MNPIGGQELPLIGRWSDESFTGGEEVWLDTVSRYGARGILVDEQGRTAMLYMTKDQRYKLPGGGLESGEDPGQAFLREIREETGWEAVIVHELGYCEEHKNKNQFMHLSFCYIAKALHNHKDISLTENEIKLGMMVEWMSLASALQVMERALADCDDYSARFMLTRDLTILKQAIAYVS